MKNRRQALNVLVKGEAEVSADFVAVPGLLKTHFDYWSSEDSAGSSWLSVFSSQFPGSRVSSFDYPVTDSCGGIFTRNGARCQALRLLDALVELRKDGAEDCNLFFIGHDVGGTLVKEALVFAGQNPEKYGSLFLHTCAIIFLGCPHRGGGTYELRRDFVKLLSLRDCGCVDDENAWLATRSITAWVGEVNSTFAESRLSIWASMISVFSSHEEPALRVFDEYVTTMTLPFEARLATNLPHKDMACEGPDIDFTPLLKAALWSRASRNGHYILSLASQAPPQYPLEAPTQDSRRLERITGQETFQKWQKGDGLERLVLHVGSGKAAIQTAQCLFHYMDRSRASSGQRRTYLYFGFKSSDSRQNSIESMLYSCLAQIISRSHHYEGETCEAIVRTYQQAFQAFEKFRWWNRDDLFVFFMEILLNLGAKDRGVVLVLGNLQDNISSCDWFLTKVSKLADDHEFNFKVLVTTPEGAKPDKLALWQRTSADAEDRSKSEPTVDSNSDIPTGHEKKEESPNHLDRMEDSDEGKYEAGPTHNHDLRFEFLKLAYNNPRLEADSAELFHLLQACKDDKDLRLMIIDWHQTRNSISSIVTSVLHIPRSTTTTPETVFKAILTSIPLPMDKFLRNLLNLLLYSFRPLGVSELNDLAKCDGMKNPGEVEDLPGLSLHPRIQIALHGLVQINQNEVQFAHPDLHRYLLSGESPLASSQGKAHQEIADFCLEYISTQGSDCIDKYRSPGKMTIAVEWRHSFLDYAVRWWPSHARLSEAGRAYCTSQLIDFLKNASLLVPWAEMHWELQNPFRRGSIAKNEPLAILASYGFSDVLARINDNQRTSETYDDLLCHEIVESLEAATANGELETALKLFKRPISPSEGWDNVILAAMQSGNQQLITESVNFGLRDPKNIQDASLLLCRASSVGQAAVVQALLPVAIDRGLKNTTIAEMTALQHASSRGNLEAAKLLVDYDDILFENAHNETSLDLACKFGRSEIIGFLTTTIISRNERTNGFGTTADLAIRLGNHRALDDLLETLKLYHLEAEIAQACAHKVIDSEHIKCWHILWKYIKNLVKPGSDAYTEVLKQAMKSGVRPVYCDLLNVRDSLADGSYTVLLRWAIDFNFELQAIEAIVATVAKQYTAQQISSTLGDALGPAVKQDREDVVSLLVRAGAVLNNKDFLTRTPLYHAAFAGKTGIARILIEAGADNEVPGYDGWRPIHAAYDNADMTRLLIQNGADINAKTGTGSTPLYLASKWEEDNVVAALLEFSDKIGIDAKQDALSIALSKGRTRSVRRLLDAGVDPRKFSSQGTQELMTAVDLGNAVIVKMLLEFNIDLEKARDPYGCSVLNRAVVDTTQGSDHSVIKALVNRGSDLESATNDGYTPLCNAIWRDNVEVARYLISKDAKINVTGGPYGAPLMVACRTASLDMVQLLCQHGADTNFVDPGQCGTPLQAVLLRDPGAVKDSIIKCLLDDVENKADANLRSDWWGGPLNVAVLNGSIDVVKSLLNRGAKVDAADKVGRRAIHFALYRTKDRVELLCQPEYGANIFELDKMKRGALHLAVVSGRLDLVQYVLGKAKEKSIDVVNAKDTDEWTPLLWAMRVCPLWEAQSKQREAILKHLLDHKADLYAEGLGLDRKWTALKLAKHYGLPDDIVQFLEERGREIGASSGQQWDVSSRHAKKAKFYDDGYYCDACLTPLVGVYYQCDECGGFCLCFKCYRSKDIVHPGHLFTDSGSEYDDEDMDDYHEDVSDAQGPAEGEADRVHIINPDIDKAATNSDIAELSEGEGGSEQDKGENGSEEEVGETTSAT